MGLFKKHERSSAYLKCGIYGFAGAGKTFTATEIATGLVHHLRKRGLPEGDRPVLFLDTETGSDYVEHKFKAAGVELHSAKTRAFADLRPAVREAEQTGALLIIDSLTHFWREFCDSYAKKKNRQRGLEFSDWAYLKREWGWFTDDYVNSRAHIIICGRAGFEYDHYVDDAGKKQIEKSGVQMKAEKETGYEPSLLILMEREMDMDTKVVSRSAVVVKERFNVIDGKTFPNPTFKDFLPHIDLLNLGGQQLGVDTSRTSEDMIPESEEWMREKKILLEEIEAEMKLKWPGQSATDKTAKINAIKRLFGTGSWAKVETLNVTALRGGLEQLKSMDQADELAAAFTGAAE